MPFDPTTQRHYVAAPITNATGTADTTWSANEVTLVNDLLTKFNAVLAALRAAGIVQP
jgi:hypothetical protein